MKVVGGSKPLSIILIVSLFWGGCARVEQKEHLITLNGLTMGTTYSIKVTGVEKSQFDPAALQSGIDEVLTTVNQQMSMYIPNSEISRFNRSRTTDWFDISADTALVLDTALKVSRQSNGAFDITVGPLINLWGFGIKRREEIPEKSAIKEALKKIGYQHLSVRLDPPAVKKAIPELYCDLSAIAKGYGVDRVAKFLESRGIARYMVEIGGEVRTRGKNPQNRWWRIGIVSPNHFFGLQKIVYLKDTAMATSGDYRNYFEKDGVRYSHTIDPRTGRPITHHLASVTVIHPSCTMADALATAIDVQGPQKGYDLAIRQNLPTYFIIRRDNGFEEKMTPQFSKFLQNNDNMP
jgi:thiamine biosynthesis lipoprotein